MDIEKSRSAIVALAGALAVWSAPAEAVVRFAAPAARGSGSCNSPANAGTVAACVAVAVAGDNVALESGDYFVSGVTIPVSLAINGAGIGVTRVSAQGNDRHFLVDPGAGGSVLIKDLTLRNGNPLAVAAFEDGGAVRVVTGSLELIRTEIRDSSAFNGGAVSCDGCTDLIVRDSRLAHNTADADGGAIETDADVTLVSGTVIQDNEAADQGGGIYKVRNTMTVIDSELVGNVADDDGGGLYSSQDDTKVLRSSFIGNSSTQGNGGGVSMHGSQLADELLVLNSTFSANAALAGGAVDVGVNNPAFLGNVTMVDNHSTVAGQADDIESASGTDVTLSNSILTHPALGGGGNPECGNAGVALNLDGTGNLIDTVASCQGNAGGFRLGALSAGSLDVLGFYGGPTRTYALLAGSNAIDDPAVGECLNPRTGAVLDKDQRSQPRPTGAGAFGDIGAYEF